MKNLRITVEGKVYDVQVELLDGESTPAPAPRRSSGGASGRVAAPAPKKAAAPAPKAAPAPTGDGSVVSPLAAVVVSVDVAVGDSIEPGQKVATLEAMKMNTIVSAATGGTVESILVNPGDGVEEGQAILEIA